MPNKTRNHINDLRGVGKLAIEATLGIANLVEAVNAAVVPAPRRTREQSDAGTASTRSRSASTRTIGNAAGEMLRGIRSLVFDGVRGATRVVGNSMDASLDLLSRLHKETEPSPGWDSVLAAVNGVLGDYLAATNNPLAMEMQLRHQGQALTLTEDGLARAISQPTPKLLLLVHGLCSGDRQWQRNGHDHGVALARDLGYTAVYVRYNTGLHVSTNGQTLAPLFEQLLRAWPSALNDVAILTHSMGGLVARSAFHYATQAHLRWPAQVRRLIFLGTPHQGAPFERGGNWVDTVLDATAYTAPFSRLGKLRSAGITDLRYGNVLDGDWRAWDRFAPRRDHRLGEPLPTGVNCFAIAATSAARPKRRSSTEGTTGKTLPGDGFVPVASAFGKHREPRLTLTFPKAHQWIAYQTSHLDLLSSPAVYAQVRRWLSAEPRAAHR